MLRCYICLALPILPHEVSGEQDHESNKWTTYQALAHLRNVAHSSSVRSRIGERAPSAAGLVIAEPFI